MPDAPKKSFDDAYRDWIASWRHPDSSVAATAFHAGWRAAMAEVKKKTATGAPIVHTANCNITEKLSDVCSCGAQRRANWGSSTDKPRYDHSREGF